MGMYTSLVFSAELKKDTPKHIIDGICYLIGELQTKPKELPDFGRNPLVGSSCYFPEGISSFEPGTSDSWSYPSLNIVSNIKNYNNEIQNFLTWVEPYIEKGHGVREWYAIVTYEENEIPTIHYLIGERS